MTAPDLGLTPLVTVIVAARDAARTLPDTLASIQAQTYRPIETLVVDDGSSDATGKIAAGCDGVRVIRIEESVGPAAARNLALDEAEGELIAFIDADDLMPPDKFAVQVPHLMNHPGLDMNLGKQDLLLEEGAEEPVWLPEDRMFGEPGGIPLNSVLARREVLDAVRLDPGLIVGEWRDWLFRVREAGYTYEVLDHVVLTRRVHGNNMSYRTVEMRAELMASLQRKIARGRDA